MYRFRVFDQRSQHPISAELLQLSYPIDVIDSRTQYRILASLRRGKKILFWLYHSFVLQNPPTQLREKLGAPDPDDLHPRDCPTDGRKRHLTPSLGLLLSGDTSRFKFRGLSCGYYCLLNLQQRSHDHQTPVSSTAPNFWVLRLARTLRLSEGLDEGHMNARVCLKLQLRNDL